ncbi:MAG: glycosyltransferase family 2 protein [Ideonella sp.]|nr:glycosyltransferase family 2 protein [Ideonella sp.]MCC7457889.1 glycosyltransferase family 2 protein [Nitrospira sp.]
MGTATLALVTIARDEARCIERCLDSVRPHVDHLLVLDTGSRDATPQLARRAGARVEHFAWCDDFAAARNAALHAAEAAGASWSLVLDADEWLLDGSALKALRARVPDFVGVVRVDNLYGASEADAARSTSWISRVLPRGARYEGRIHEQPEMRWPRRRLPLVIGHDGYLDAPMRGKRGRNRRLLQRALDDAPDDPYLHYQLGKDHELQARFDLALPHYQRAQAQVTPADPWRHDLMLRLLFTLKRLQRFEQAQCFAQAQLDAFADSPDYCFALGDLLLDWAAHAPARGAELLPLIETAWQRAVAIGERPELPDSVVGRGSFLAAHNLAVLYAGLGRTADAALWRGREQTMRAALNP